MYFIEKNQKKRYQSRKLDEKKVNSIFIVKRKSKKSKDIPQKKRNCFMWQTSQDTTITTTTKRSNQERKRVNKMEANENKRKRQKKGEWESKREKKIVVASSKRSEELQKKKSFKVSILKSTSTESYVTKLFGS